MANDNDKLASDLMSDRELANALLGAATGGEIYSWPTRPLIAYIREAVKRLMGRAELAGKATAWDSINTRSTDAHAYCRQYPMAASWGKNTWHSILDDAIRLRRLNEEVTNLARNRQGTIDELRNEASRLLAIEIDHEKLQHHCNEQTVKIAQLRRDLREAHAALSSLSPAPAPLKELIERIKELPTYAVNIAGSEFGGLIHRGDVLKLVSAFSPQPPTAEKCICNPAENIYCAMHYPSEI